MVQTIPRDESITVDTSSIEVSSSKYGTKRLFIALTNRSAGGQVITVAWGKPAEANKGIPLLPGGVISISLDSAYTPSNEAINAISDIAGGILSIHEEVSF